MCSATITHEPYAISNGMTHTMQIKITGSAREIRGEYLLLNIGYLM